MNPPPVMLADADNGLFSLLHTMSGPNFLLLYGVWFIVTFGGTLLLRLNGENSPAITIIGLLCYELLGIVRIVDGSAHGMHKWLFLILMMIVGGIIFLIRAAHIDNTDGGGGWWSSNCSSGGGCGGGGGGGGGCGGCGGS